MRGPAPVRHHRPVRIRRWRDDDVPALVAMAERAGAAGSRALLEGQLAHQRLAARGGGHVFVRLVAERDGELVASAVARDQLFVPRGWLDVRVHVREDHRHAGIGTALAVSLGRELSGERGAGLVARVPAGDRAALAWAGRWGFAVALEEVRCVVDPGRVPVGPAGRRHGVDGVSVFAMSDPVRGGDWDRLHALVARLLADIPEMRGRPGPRADAVASTFTHLLRAWPEATWVAARGECWVGASVAGRQGEHGLFTWLTGVEAVERGRGVGTALKLAAVDGARAAGVTRMVSEVAAANAPMLALNRRLGCAVHEPVLVLHRPPGRSPG